MLLMAEMAAATGSPRVNTGHMTALLHTDCPLVQNVFFFKLALALGLYQGADGGVVRAEGVGCLALRVPCGFTRAS